MAPKIGLVEVLQRLDHFSERLTYRCVGRAVSGSNAMHQLADATGTVGHLSGWSWDVVSHIPPCSTDGPKPPPNSVDSIPVRQQ